MVAGISKHFKFGTNKKQAEADLRQLETDIASGKIQFAEQETSQVVNADGKKDMRIEELAVRHLEWVKGNRAPGTLRNRKHFVNQFLGYIGECMVSGITRMKLEDFYLWAKENKGRSDNGGNQQISHVKTFLRWGEEMEIIDLPFKRFPRITYTLPDVTIVDRKTLLLILATASPDFRDMIIFGLLTGLRPFELRPLKQSQISYLPDGRPYIVIQKHKTSKTASSPSPRSVVLCQEAERIFKRNVDLHPKSEYVFLNEDGNPFTAKAFNDRFERICLRLSIPKIKPYDLRHTFASMLSDGGTETTALAKLMGHSSTRTLMRYVKNSHEHYKKAIDGLETALMPALLVEYNDAPPPLGKTGNSNRRHRKPYSEHSEDESK